MTFTTITAHDWLTKCFQPFRAAGGTESNVAWKQIQAKIAVSEFLGRDFYDTSDF